MAKKIYLVGKKVEGDEIQMVPYRAYPTFESAKRSVLNHTPEDRRLVATEMKNEFKVTDADGNYIHTIAIRDIWLDDK